MENHKNIADPTVEEILKTERETYEFIKTGGSEWESLLQFYYLVLLSSFMNWDIFFLQEKRNSGR